MTIDWDTTKIAKVLESAFSPPSSPHGSKKQANGKSRQDEEAPNPTIDILITFDRQGISGHKNHISLYHGAKAWFKSMMKNNPGWECPVTLYTLTSTSILRKYISVLDAPFTMLQCVLRSVSASSKSSDGSGRNVESSPQRLIYLSDIMAYRRAQQAMTQAHKSQMRWFRWGWIAMCRYMVVNDLRREKIG